MNQGKLKFFPGLPYDCHTICRPQAASGPGIPAAALSILLKHLQDLKKFRTVLPKLAYGHVKNMVGIA